MKIIKDYYNKETVSEEYICEECNSVFEYDDYDVYVDLENNEYVTCPCCNHRCVVYTPPTIETIKFPKDFYQFGIHNGAVNISDNEINDYIKKCIKWLIENPNEAYRYMAFGDTFVCVFNHEDEYYIMVAKNYFDIGIDK